LAVLDKPEPELPATGEMDIQAELERVNQMKMVTLSHKRFVKAFDGSTGNVVCPTCRQPVSNAEELVAQFKPELEAYESEIAKSQAAIDTAAQAVRDYESAVAVYKAEKLRAHQRADELKAQIAEMEHVAPVDGALEQRLTKDVETFDAHAAQRDQLQETLAALRNSVAAKEGQLKELRRQLDKLQADLSESPHEQAYQESGRAIALVDGALRQIADLEGQLKQLQAQRARTLSELEELRQQAQSLEAKRTYQQMCEKARTVLHRDCLPQMVTRAYLQALNARMDEYLQAFDAPFGCEIKDDLTVSCKTVNAGERPADRLSGGEKVMLGIAFRFAVYNLFAGHLGFMVLDEPTNMLDDDHIGSVVGVLESVRRYAHNTGMQLVVITHKEQLVGTFDHVIRL
jgi:exonuclease SbcC